MSAIISSTSSVRISGDPPAFLFFARGASTAEVSCSFDVSSVRRPPVLSAERQNPSSHGFIRLIILRHNCVLLFPIRRSKWPPITALVTTISHYHFQMARAMRFRRSCQYGFLTAITLHAILFLLSRLIQAEFC